MKSIAFTFGLLTLAITCLAAPAKSASQDKMESSAQTRTPVVLELFTSEGCSSCPPADRLLQSLDEKQPFAGADLIVLSEHVDYWNSLGWSDPYSSKAFSMRQRQYAEQLGLDGVYTPQLVIDGKRESVGSNAVQAKMGVEQAAQLHKVALTLSKIAQDGKRLTFHAASADLKPEDGPATLYIAVAENRAQSSVQRGENAGRSLTHVAVVKSLQPLGTVAKGGSLSQDLSVSLPSSTAGLRLIAFLQADKSHRIVGAAQSKL